MKKICPHRTPPSSSYSHSPQETPAINLNELVQRIGIEAKLSSQPQAYPSFISHLPPEVLSEIFLYCIPHEQFPVACRTQAPLLLTQVSAGWRALALASPDLWTSLHINYKDPVEDIPATDLWLSRSGNKPLTLSIAVDFGEQPQQEIIDAICRHSKRWRHVRFDFRHLLCPRMYSLNLAQDQVPELSTFEFHARDISNINVSPITRLLRSAPKLRELTWVDDLADTDTLLELPLGRLTRLSLEMDHGTLDYLQVLNECSNLEHIRITRPSATTPQTRPPLFLPKLVSLNISSDLTGICDHLVLPALKEVRIYAEGDKQALSHDPEPSQSHPQILPFGSPHAHHPSHSSPSSSVAGWEPTAFLSLITRSACAISSLSVTPPITEHTLLTCLRRVSDSLVKLSIDGIGVGDMLVASLTRQATQKILNADGIYDGAVISESDDCGGVEVLCPALEEISLDTRVACAQGTLAAMVESRLAHSSSRFNGQETWRSIRIRVVDGHRDLEKLRDLEARFRQQGDNSLGMRAALTVDAIPKKLKRAHPRNFFFRRKLCASR